jgi:hypothetical protein
MPLQLRIGNFWSWSRPNILFDVVSAKRASLGHLQPSLKAVSMIVMLTRRFDNHLISVEAFNAATALWSRPRVVWVIHRREYISPIFDDLQAIHCSWPSCLSVVDQAHVHKENEHHYCQVNRQREQRCGKENDGSHQKDHLRPKEQLRSGIPASVRFHKPSIPVHSPYRMEGQQNALRGLVQKLAKNAKYTMHTEP